MIGGVSWVERKIFQEVSIPSFTLGIRLSILNSHRSAQSNQHLQSLVMADPPTPADQSASNNAANSLRKLEVEYNKKVTKIAYDWKADPEWILPAVEVTCKGEKSARKYDAVFNSTTLGIQQQMSLEGLRCVLNIMCYFSYPMLTTVSA